MILPNLHPVFVHFTIGLLATSVGLFAVARFWLGSERRQHFERAARLILYTGLALTLITVATGFYAYFTVDHDDPSHAVMKVHRNLALATTLLFAAISWFMYRRNENAPSNSVMASMFVAVALLGATGWYGGELVYRHGIGVMSLPAASGEGHDHGEGEGHDDQPPATNSTMDPAQVADALHAALKSGDGDAVGSMLAQNVLILEGDHAQTNRQEYMSGHMISDMAFLPNVSRDVLSRKISQSGTVAWVTTHSRTTGEYNERMIDTETREMLVMQHDGQKWQITLVHWDNN